MFHLHLSTLLKTMYICLNERKSNQTNLVVRILLCIDSNSTLYTPDKKNPTDISREEIKNLLEATNNIDLNLILKGDSVQISGYLSGKFFTPLNESAKVFNLQKINILSERINNVVSPFYTDKQRGDIILTLLNIIKEDDTLDKNEFFKRSLNATKNELLQLRIFNFSDFIARILFFSCTTPKITAPYQSLYNEKLSKGIMEKYIDEVRSSHRTPLCTFDKADNKKVYLSHPILSKFFNTPEISDNKEPKSEFCISYRDFAVGKFLESSDNSLSNCRFEDIAKFIVRVKCSLNDNIDKDNTVILSRNDIYTDILVFNINLYKYCLLINPNFIRSDFIYNSINIEPIPDKTTLQTLSKKILDTIDPEKNFHD